MTRIPALLAAATAAGVLAAPASALAAGSAIIAGPIKVKGYDLTLTAADNGASDSFAIMAVKKSGQATQMHMWSFTSGVSVTVKGSKATIKGSLGKFGKVDGKITAGAKTRGRVPAGCTGSAGSARKGTMKGASKFVLDTTFFKTVKPKAMKALIAQGGKLQCGGSTGGTGGSDGTGSSGLMLMTSVDGAAGQLMVNIVKQGSKVTQTAMRTDAGTEPASVMHIITATTGASGLDAAADLSSATAPGVAPFFGGTMTFAGEGTGTMASGTVSGDFAAKFDSIGTQTVPAGNDAMLLQR